MKRIEPLRDEANTLPAPRFKSRWPEPVLLLRFVVEGELVEKLRGPEGTMRHTARRSLSERLAVPASDGRRPVRTERIAAVRHSDQPTRLSYLIGRDERCDVLLNDYTISAEHAKIHFLPQVSRWMIEDLGSTNCTLLNGAQLPPNERGLLTSLDELQLGRMVFLYLEPDDFYDYLRGSW